MTLRKGASERRKLKAPIDRLVAWEDVNRHKLIKQADVLMIPFLFPDAFPPDVLRANYRYYERLTDHGSSLSPSVHAAIAARSVTSPKHDATGRRTFTWIFRISWATALWGSISPRWADLADACLPFLGIAPTADGGLAGRRHRVILPRGTRTVKLWLKFADANSNSKVKGG